MTDLNSIKAKISKLLRLQQSDNAGEAANAAAFVERLCREHGLTPDDINPDHDPERDEADLLGGLVLLSSGLITPTGTC